jgi:cell division protein FtsZ
MFLQCFQLLCPLDISRINIGKTLLGESASFQRKELFYGGSYHFYRFDCSANSHRVGPRRTKDTLYDLHHEISSLYEEDNGATIVSSKEQGITPSLNYRKSKLTGGIR